MKLLVLGGGGREHAICWKMAQHRDIQALFCAPGNAGIASIAQCIDLPSQDNFSDLVRFVRQEKIDLTLVGPEAPLVAGIVDIFQQEGLTIFGPCQKAAQLEGSKVFAKRFMARHDIPTAEFEVFSNPEQALTYIDTCRHPLVIKADGLAQGKGVFVTNTKAEAQQAVSKIMVEKAFGAAGEHIVLERKLQGRELSFLIVTDGVSIKPLVSSQDHKPLSEGNRGPNTGGMGAYSPAPLSPKLYGAIMRKVVTPTLRGLKQENISYTGVLYFGLMISQDTPYVLEYNCRFGDPETQVILPRLRTDLVDLALATTRGNLSQTQVHWRNDAAACVILASRGYPGHYEKGVAIHGLEALSANTNIFAFSAGVDRQDNQYVTAGGRVLGITATGKNINSAAHEAYRAVAKIQFEGMCYRKDIGRAPAG